MEFIERLEWVIMNIKQWDGMEWIKRNALLGIERKGKEEMVETNGEKIDRKK